MSSTAPACDGSAVAIPHRAARCFFRFLLRQPRLLVAPPFPLELDRPETASLRAGAAVSSVSSFNRVTRTSIMLVEYLCIQEKIQEGKKRRKPGEADILNFRLASESG